MKLWVALLPVIVRSILQVYGAIVTSLIVKRRLEEICFSENVGPARQKHW